MPIFGSDWADTSYWGLFGSPGPQIACNLVNQRMLLYVNDENGPSDYEKFVCIFAEQFGYYADVIRTVSSAFNLEFAVGDALSQLASLVGENRQGADDDLLRRVLEVQTQIIQGQGTAASESKVPTGVVNNILQIIRTFIGDEVGGTVEYTLTPPYSFIISFPNPLTAAETKKLAVLVGRALWAAVLGLALIDIAGPNNYDSFYGGVPPANVGVYDSFYGGVATPAVYSYYLIIQGSP